MVASSLLAGMLILFFITVPIVIFCIICLWIVFQKAGKPGWPAIIPIYNLIVLLEIVGRPWWWIFLLCATVLGSVIHVLAFVFSIVSIVFGIIMDNSLSKSFGKSTGFTVGLIFLAPIFLAILAFSKDIKYIGPNGISAAGGNTAVPPAAPPQA